MLIADFAFNPGSIAMWLVIGLVVGWLAGKVMENPSYGTVGDLLLGSIGALVGGAMPGFFVEGDPVIWVALLTAFAGSCILIGVFRVVVAFRSA